MILASLEHFLGFKISAGKLIICELLLCFNLFVSLMSQTGGTEEVYKEQKRQQELENNYRFVWGESQEESQSSSTSDSDDVDI